MVCVLCGGDGLSPLRELEKVQNTQYSRKGNRAFVSDPPWHFSDPPGFFSSNDETGNTASFPGVKKPRGSEKCRGWIWIKSTVAFLGILGFLSFFEFAQRRQPITTTQDAHHSIPLSLSQPEWYFGSPTTSFFNPISHLEGDFS
jgi:hypothetical protein